MKLYTIGFTQKTARQFFDLLRANRIECVVDIRLHPDGQLAGFSKREDLRYFLRALNDCDYLHLDQLAPTESILKAYHSNKNWPEFRDAFLALLAQREIPQSLDRAIFDEKICCLLCSESTPDHCHRRLVAETFAQAWGDVEIHHI